jgi:hypothetical protein
MSTTANGTRRPVMVTKRCPLVTTALREGSDSESASRTPRIGPLNLASRDERRER